MGKRVRDVGLKHSSPTSGIPKDDDSAIDIYNINIAVSSNKIATKARIVNTNTPINMTIDTGAAMSCIDDSFRPENIKLSNAKAVGATGVKLDVTGKAEINIKIGRQIYPLTVLFVRNLCAEGLLGSDFINAHAKAINIKTKKLILKKGKAPIQIFNTDKYQIGHVTLAENVVVAPQHKAIANCRVFGTKFKTGMVNPTQRTDETFMIGRSISTLKNGTVRVPLLNTTNKAVHLQKGMKIGKFEKVHILSVSQHDDTKPTDFPEVQIQHDKLTQEQSKTVEQLIMKYRHIFASNKDELGRYNRIKHEITTMGPPIRQGLRRYNNEERKIIKTETEKMLKQGIIKPSASPWASPVVLVKKKDGTIRFCVDYRQLNSVTIRDNYPLPRIDDTLDTLGGARIFSTFDMQSGFNQIEVEEQSKPKTAFLTPTGLYSYEVLPFGLCNGPAIYQRIMNLILHGLIGEECLVYLDDIIVFSKTFDEHIRHLENMFKRIEESGLKIKASKCNIACDRVKYLGHIVTPNGILPDESKIEAVKRFPVPKDTTHVKSFLGLTGYYRKFIPEYAKIAAPLQRLANCNDISFVWDAAAKEAFETLKQKLISPPILAYPLFELPFRVYTDASNFAIGAVLSQSQNGKEVVIAYASRPLNDTERKKSATERELIGSFWAIKQFSPYLKTREQHGKFTLVTDHNPNKFIIEGKDKTGKLQRYLDFIQNYDFDVEYKPGKTHGNADALSRRPDYAIAAISDDAITIEDMVKAQKEDENTNRIIKELKNENSRFRERYKLKNGLLLRTKTDDVDKIVVPFSLRKRVLEQLHDRLGHMGRDRTMARLSERFYWKHCADDVRRYVATCINCQQRKSEPITTRAQLQPIDTSEPMELVCWDIMGVKPAAKSGAKYVLMIGDHFTKYVEAFPLNDQKAETVTAKFKSFSCRHGRCERLLNDQGRNFESQLVNSVCDVMGTKHVRTTPYHPMANGFIERMNRTIQEILAKDIRPGRQEQWDDFLETAMFAYNTCIHESHGYAPFYLMHGFNAKFPIDVALETNSGEKKNKTKDDYAETLAKDMKHVFKTARRRLQAARQAQKDTFDQKARNNFPFQTSELVWLHQPKVEKGDVYKFHSPWRGPFTVLEKVNEVNYKVRLFDGSGPAKVVHRNNLKPFRGDPPGMDGSRIAGEKTSEQDRRWLWQFLDDGDLLEDDVDPQRTSKVSNAEFVIPQQITRPAVVPAEPASKPVSNEISSAAKETIEKVKTRGRPKKAPVIDNSKEAIVKVEKLSQSTIDKIVREGAKASGMILRSHTAKTGNKPLNLHK